MHKDIIPFEEALALKELGFNEPCFGYYVDGELRGINLGIEELGGIEPYYQRFGFHEICNSDIDNNNKIIATAPLYSQAFRFFRNCKYYLDSKVFRDYKFKSIIRYEGFVDDTEVTGDRIGMHTDYRDTYEEAELLLLQLIISQLKRYGKTLK